MTDTTSNLDQMTQDFLAVSDTYTGTLTDPHPYPMYAELRSKCPVMQGDILAQYKVPSQADYARSGRPVMSIFKYDDVLNILRDTAHWKSYLNGDGFGAAVDGLLLTAMDGEQHKSFRNLLMPPFLLPVARRFKETLIRPILQKDFIDVLKPQGKADLVQEFALPFPVWVICSLFGFPEDRDAVMKFAGRALRILAGPQPDPEKAKASMAAAFQAAQDLYDHVRPIVAARRASGDFAGGDLMGHLLQADAKGANLDDHKITNIIRMLLPAAAETTTRSFANMMVLLLDRPELLDRIRADRKLVGKAINESLRYEPVSAFLAREASRDVEIGGVTIPKGAAISLANGAANRDEAAFPNGETFDIDRPVKPILSFGFGAHTCLGLAIAKLEMESALNAVLDHMPNLRYDPEQPPARIVGITLRGPRAIHVVHD